VEPARVTERMSLEQWRGAMGIRGRAAKYSNEKTVVDGRKFDSKLEALRYIYWSNLWRSKAIRYFLTQVPFRLPGGIVYRLDFLVMHLDGPPSYEDTKGVLTRVSINKIRQVEEIYGIKIDLVKKGKT
jgi:hypothetical protein